MGQDPVALLRQELQCEDTTARRNAVERIASIAASLGAEGAAQQLVPVIPELVEASKVSARAGARQGMSADSEKASAAVPPS